MFYDSYDAVSPNGILSGGGVTGYGDLWCNSMNFSLSFLGEGEFDLSRLRSVSRFKDKENRQFCPGVSLR